MQLLFPTKHFQKYSSVKITALEDSKKLDLSNSCSQTSLQTESTHIVDTAPENFNM